MKLQKTLITQDQKNLLEELIGINILQRTTSKPLLGKENDKIIDELLLQSQNNTIHYLDRNRLGHNLNIFDQNSLYTTIVELGNFLKLKKPPRRIECYDISHLQGTKVYGSMVSFVDGVSTPKWYRLFKCKEQNNDFENHAEVMRRRLQKAIDYELELKQSQETGVEVKLDKAWSLPDLIIVDGGKGQLSSDYEVLVEFGLQHRVEMISLAKAQEEIFLSDMHEFQNYSKGRQGGILLTGEMLFLVQRIRDEAHRFAIKNNRNSRLKAATKTILDTIPGIGEVSKQSILKNFGSVQNAMQTIYQNPQLAAEKIGSGTVKKLKQFFE
jgi:excinuclease ABC subunit C